MLEKIGLPPKPSLRGNNWVVDASHCQGCTSQFTFINRKHHCRRCGGLFCNSCTQQRMFLRGQGDSPVRICDACKKLEEAARFEMRHGHKKAAKGSSKHESKNEDEVLNEILGNEKKESISSRETLSHDQQTYVASSSNSEEVFTTPEELRQQAVEEKKKHRTLKAEGKSEEALRAFKRGKELERQAAALEVQLRKNRKKASSSSSNISDILNDADESSRKNKSSPQTSEKKDDLASELRELGWSDMDLHEADKKPAPVSLEGELSALLGEISEKPNAGKRKQTVDKSQVIAHKKRALEFKREGKLSEAKEELKKAKILEKKIEEQEFLIDSEESDDEISSLIRSLGSDTQEELSLGVNKDSNFDFNDIFSAAENLGADLEVNDDDLDDPEMAAALKSLGWSEDVPEPVPVDRESKQAEVQSLKREALSQKRAGNTSGAMELLKKAKMIEKELDSSSPQQTEDVDEVKEREPKTAPKNKMAIQKELLSVKKKALALRREGKIDEAEEELRKGKVLEKQLEEFDNAPKATQPPVNDVITDTDVGDDEDVTDRDMQDPNYISLLKNLGWQDEDSENVTSNTDEFSALKVIAKVPRRSKAEIQKELLGLKRKALALRRQGDSEAAEEVLETTKKLEAELAEIESATLNAVTAEPNVQKERNFIDSPLENLSNAPSGSRSDPSEEIPGKPEVTVSSDKNPSNPPQQTTSGREKPEEIVSSDKKPSDPPQQTTSQSESNSLHQEILAHKRKALALKREGKLAEAKEELRQAKTLEKRLEEEQPVTSASADVSSPETSPPKTKDVSPSPPPASKPLSGRERFKLQQESLNHKRQALKLRREGRTQEADAEFELAKAIEAQLEELNTGHGAEPADDVSVEDFLDPQLLSALAAIGISDTATVPQAPEKSETQKPTGGPQGLQRPESKKSASGSGAGESSSEEKTQLEEKIKAEKLKALTLKRSGKQAEALEALRRAKLFEKKLNSLN